VIADRGVERLTAPVAASRVVRLPHASRDLFR
jgi:hypothetical protein